MSTADALIAVLGACMLLQLVGLGVLLLIPSVVRDRPYDEPEGDDRQEQQPPD